MIKVGIIGFGKMGQIRALTLAESKRADIVTIYDLNPIDNPPAKVALSVDEIINDSSIDAIFICTPNYLIPEMCIKSLRAGKHVFSEKPPALNAKQLVEVIKTEKGSSGLKLMYGFNHRHHESIIRMKEIVGSGEMGRILWMRGRYGKEVDESFLNGWRANPQLSGGGIFLDQGIHMLDLFLHFGGDFDQAHSFVSNLFWKLEGVEDNVFAIYKNTSSGICASLHSTMTQWRYLFSLEVFLGKGALILNGLKTSSGVYGDEVLTIKKNLPKDKSGQFEQDETFTYKSDSSWLSEINHFFDCIEKEVPINYGSSSDALKLMRLVDKTYE